MPTGRVSVYNRASELPQEFRDALMQDEPAANTILPFANKARNSLDEDDKEQLWIILRGETDNNVEFILSCTEGEMGKYPIFVFVAKPSSQLSDEEKLGKDMDDLVVCLLSEVPGGARRVFSVFSKAKVAEKFAQRFEQRAQEGGYNIQICKDLLYDATFTFCTRETLNTPSDSFPSIESDDILISLRPANHSQLEGVTAMCKGFSVTSPPYTLDDARAELEAKTLINNQQVWVHMIKQGDEDWETACIVATTRESENVTVITKVFTAERWRGRGCAGRLLHRICRDVLNVKPCVVLYVGNGDELLAARKLYHRVGFQGLNARPGETVEGVERWLEIGFGGTDLGYW